MSKSTALPQPRLAVDKEQTGERSATRRLDPYWNHVARTALFYSAPLILVGLCLERGIGSSRDFWVPLIFTLLALAPATRRWAGRPFAHKDFQNRDAFIATYALAPAAIWYLSIGLAPSWPVAAVGFLLVSIAYDALLLRAELLHVFAVDEGQALVRFSLPLWTYAAAALTAVHLAGSDTLGGIAVGGVITSLPVLAVWLYLRQRRAPRERLTDIQRVAVVGAGWSGLLATKELQEAGLEVVNYESTDSLGGVWKYREDRPSGVARSTRATSSKHFLHPSDFPLPPEVDDFPHHTEILEHLARYCEHFGLTELIRLDTAVVATERTQRGWRVVTRDPSGAQSEETFDAVAICSGPHQEPSVDPATDPLYGRFTGRLKHSADYKTADEITGGSTVLIVGAGESSADIVAECVQSGAEVHWATRSGQWFADRNMGPYPADHITTQGTRVFAGLFGNLEYIVRRFVARTFVNLAWGRGGHGVRGWLPETPYLHQFLNKSRDGVMEIYRGNVTPHLAPERIDGREVTFADRDQPLAVDTIILATGYRATWPFLERQPTGLYKLVFDPDDPTLAFVGFARPIVGSIPSLSEMQARWLAAVWSGGAPLPARQRRRAELRADTRQHSRLIRDSSPLGILVDQELYATELASRIDAEVHWLKLLVTWPKAFFTVLASPWIACKYRLNDPDPDRRRQALVHMVRELPDPRAPNYLLAVGIAVFVAILLGGTALIFWALPVPKALIALALVLLAGSILLRLSESDGLPGTTPLGKLREIFPW